MAADAEPLAKDAAEIWLEMALQNATSDAVAFSAGRTTDLGPISEDRTIEFDKVNLNRGERFEPYSSQFFALNAGFHLFSATLHGNNIASMQIKRNNDVVSHFRSYHGGGSSTVVLNLAAMDVVWVELTMDDDRQITCDADGLQCTFSGVML